MEKRSQNEFYTAWAIEINGLKKKKKLKEKEKQGKKTFPCDGDMINILLWLSTKGFGKKFRCRMAVCGIQNIKS